MRKKAGLFLGYMAVVLGVVSALLSIAPFTPAIVLTAVAMPAAIIAALSGAWRLGVLGFYWATLAIFAFPTITPTNLEALVGLAYPLGLALGAALYLHYRRATENH